MSRQTPQLKGYFITGTDTGVGKTMVAVALVCLLNRRGVRAAPVKPVQTGVPPGGRGDLEVCLEAAGLSPGPEELALLNPYRFLLAASPHLAAEREGVAIDPAWIVECCRKLAQSWQALVVEGAGGLLAPLTREYSTLDLAVELGLPLVVVTRPGLGTLNHTLLTLCAARATRLKIACVVFNRTEAEAGLSEDGRLIERDNVEMIRNLGGVEVAGPLPFIINSGGDRIAVVEISRHFEKEYGTFLPEF
ncbi:MAG TPA: dethiobiotin synthase [Candidatus Glassbacteria bacterium]|nr:dethiobiotin synthase [Candidatus Glassbacteria bacterium]